MRSTCWSTESINRRIEVDVFPASQFRVEADAELNHGPDLRATANQHPSGRRTMDAGNEFEQRALARAVPAHEAKRFAAADRERDVAQRPEVLYAWPVALVDCSQDARLQRMCAIVMNVETLRYLFGDNERSISDQLRHGGLVGQKDAQAADEGADRIDARNDPDRGVRRHAVVEDVLIRADERGHRTE